MSLAHMSPCDSRMGPIWLALLRPMTHMGPSGPCKSLMVPMWACLLGYSFSSSTWIYFAQDGSNHMTRFVNLMENLLNKYQTWTINHSEIIGEARDVPAPRTCNMTRWHTAPTSTNARRIGVGLQLMKHGSLLFLFLIFPYQFILKVACFSNLNS